MVWGVPRESVLTLVSGLLGVAEVEGGPTHEQVVVIGAISGHLWQVDASTLAWLAGAEPSAVAEQLVDELLRRRFVQLAIVVAFCRHPNVAEQVARLEAYAAA